MTSRHGISAPHPFPASFISTVFHSLIPKPLYLSTTLASVSLPVYSP